MLSTPISADAQTDCYPVCSCREQKAKTFRKFNADAEICNILTNTLTAAMQTENCRLAAVVFRCRFDRAKAKNPMRRDAPGALAKTLFGYLDIRVSNHDTSSTFGLSALGRII